MSEDTLERIAAALESLAFSQARSADAQQRVAAAMEKMEAAPDPINVLPHVPASAPADPWGSLWDMVQAMNPMAPRRTQ